ncbi:UNVERIFIED_CONTAM: Peptidyl-prolyl isomerase cwc27 [Siphonaria sp. JEL0065]|nr:Peptidyl-prolyl isomerase cwc27 [Siphonaria sp. JEL0065]
MSYAYVTEPPTKARKSCAQDKHGGLGNRRTGIGGESTYGEPFEDEFHSRLRFSHRGLLAMANTGRHTNTSQFFFTLDKTEDLNKKNTIFGKIVGDTIYNLLEIGETEVTEDEKPLYPIKINSVDVVFNPFDDIEPRTTAQERAAKLAEERLKAERGANKKTKGKKNLSLLSFGDEAASEEAVIKSTKNKIASSHDLLDDGRLSKEATASKDELLKKAAGNPIVSDGEKKSPGPAAAPFVPAKRVWDDETDEEDSDDDNSADERAQRDKAIEAVKQKLADSKSGGSGSKVSSVRAEIERVQNELRQMDASRKANTQAAKSEVKGLNPLEAFRAQYKGKAIMGKRTKTGLDDTDVLKSLAAFKDKLSQPIDSSHKTVEKEEKTCELHGLTDCKSCKRDDGEDEDEDDSGWFTNKLTFKRDPANVYEPVVDDYSYFDPRDPNAAADKYKKREGGKEVGRDNRGAVRDSGSSRSDRDRGNQRRRDDDRRDYDRRDRDYDRNRDRNSDRRDGGRRDDRR